MKNIIFLILISLSVSFIYGQTIYDGYVGVLTLSPSSPYAINNLPFVSVPGTGTVTIGANTGTGYEPISWGTAENCTAQACKLVVTISTTVNQTIITGIPTGGSFTSKFDWVLTSSNVLTGTQRSDVNGGDINPGAAGNIIFPILHIAPSTINDPIGVTHPCDQPGNNCTLGFTQGFNGVVVNIQMPSQGSNDYPAALLVDDNNGAYVFARTLLPIQYTDLTLVDKQESGIQLLWKSVNEKNTKEFEIERKYNDNKDWMVIGKSNASGNTTGEMIYKFLDNTYVSKPKIYYRIKAVDTDGKHVYTNIRSINLSNISGITIQGYPNPVQNTYHLSFTAKKEESIDLSVIDLLGRTISTRAVSTSEGTNYYDLDVTKLPQGAYVVRLTGVDHQETIKFVKQ